MHTIVVNSPGGPENMTWAEAPELAPGPGEVLLGTIAAGVNRADLAQRQGNYPPPDGASQTLGLEATGTVIAVGDGVTWPAVGATVAALLSGGGYAEQVVAPAAQCLPLPQGQDAVTTAGLVEVAATVVSNLDAVHLDAGETLLVHGGAGGIGSFAIQYGKALGCRVIATAGRPDKLEYCRGLGADVAIDYHDDWPAAVSQATGGHGADVILDVIGAAYLEANVDTLATGGRLVVIGLQKGARGTLNLGTLLSKRALVTATSLRYRPPDEKAAICRAVAQRVWPLVARGDIKPTATTKLPMSDAARAHRQLDSGDNVGKIVLVV